MSNDNITKILKENLYRNNFLDLESFLSVILYKKKIGFYNQIDPFKNNLIGVKGHFITGPEISQMFGELIAIWLIDFCQKSNLQKINLVELGPGNGTLINDVLRTIKNYKTKDIEINLFFLEISSKLKYLQRSKLKHHSLKKKWYKKFLNLKNNLLNIPTIFLANEFFDCLPINQYKFSKSENEWKKICVKIKNNDFCLDEVKLDMKDKKLIHKINNDFTFDLNKNNFIEYSRITTNIIKHISEIIKKTNGCALFIDYGKNNPFGNTLQAVQKNKKIPLFSKLENCDYSSLVDFSNIQNTAKEFGLVVYPLISQRKFFLSLGIHLRAENLARNASPSQKRNIITSVERLISKRHMGDIFKVFCMTSNKYDLIGFK